MNEASNHTAFFRGLRQTFGVTLILLFLCGLLFPVLLTGISAAVFPEQAGGSLVYADGRAVGSKYVGQEFTKPYFMKGRPSAYHYKTYTRMRREISITMTAVPSRGWPPAPITTLPRIPHWSSGSGQMWRNSSPQTRMSSGRTFPPT